MTIDDLDDDYEGYVVEEEPTQEELPQLEPSLEEHDYLSDFLRTKGIDDINNINFEGENGQIIQRGWNDLSDEEKFNILNTPLEVQQEPLDDTDGLSDDEINLINQIRQSNMSPQLYLQAIQGETVVLEPQYKIDDLSDDELFLLDLENRVGELSDEDAAMALTNAKQNEDFYKKQVEGIRKEYKEREDFQSLQEQAQYELQLQLAFEEYQAKIVDAIDGFTSIGNLDLNFNDSDKEELAEFMLSKDETGVNYLYQALQDPNTLARAAWFILNGEEAFNGITEYYNNLIKTVAQAQYNKGLEDGRNGKPTVVIKKQTPNQQQQEYKIYNSIDDLD